MVTIIVVVFISIYIIANVAAYFLQERVLFKPEKLPKDFKFNYPNQEYQEHTVHIGDEARINCAHFSVENPKGVVLYLKGNSRSIKGWGKFAVDFTRLGFDVIMLDYRGFGKSVGKRSEKNIKDDLQIVYDVIKERVEEKYIIIYGRSMGSGFAAKLASMNNPRMVIMESPYYSMTKMAKRYLPIMTASLILRYPLRTYKWIQYIKCPIKIIHGTNDKLIPFKYGMALSKINPTITRLYPVIGGGHNDLFTHEEYHRMLEEIMKSKELAPINKGETSISFVKPKKKKRNVL